MKPLIVSALASILLVAEPVRISAVQRDELSGLVACNTYVVNTKAVSGPPLRRGRQVNELRSLSPQFSGLDARIVDKQADGTLLVMFNTKRKEPYTLFAEVGVTPGANDLSVSTSKTYFLRSLGSCERWRHVGNLGLAVTARLLVRPSKTSTEFTAAVRTDCTPSAGAEVVYSAKTLFILFYEASDESSTPAPAICDPPEITVNVTLPKSPGSRRVVLLTDMPNRP
jgi:hypothetical protein